MNATKYQVIIVLGFFMVFGSKIASATPTAYSSPGAESETDFTTSPSLPKKHSSIPWNAKNMFGFLTKQNRTKAIMIRSLKVLQVKQPQDLYFQTGKEEKRKKLRQRPILTKAPAEKPFYRGVEYVVRVDRRYGIDIKVELDFIASGKKKKKSITRTPIKKLYVYTTPEQVEEIVLHSATGRFRYSLPLKTHYKKIRFQIRDSDERHNLTIRFINYKKKVSFSD
ncbi:hypothetical protein KAR34_06675 [bacterium]|nr:hypothetical protein [bacterium]